MVRTQRTFQKGKKKVLEDILKVLCCQVENSGSRRFTKALIWLIALGWQFPCEHTVINFWPIPPRLEMFSQLYFPSTTRRHVKRRHRDRDARLEKQAKIFDRRRQTCTASANVNKERGSTRQHLDFPSFVAAFRQPGISSPRSTCGATG